MHKNINMYIPGTIYTSVVLCILDYCDAVWSYCGSVIAEKLEKLQRREARYASSVILLPRPEYFRFNFSFHI